MTGTGTGRNGAGRPGRALRSRLRVFGTEKARGRGALARMWGVRGGQTRSGQGYGLGDAENPSWRGAGCGAGALGTGSHPSSPALLALQNWAQGGRPDAVAIHPNAVAIPALHLEGQIWSLGFALLQQAVAWAQQGRAGVLGWYRRHRLVSVCCVCRLAGAGRGALSCVVGTPGGPCAPQRGLGGFR